jgi:hypothetical protein
MASQKSALATRVPTVSRKTEQDSTHDHLWACVPVQNTLEKRRLAAADIKLREQDSEDGKKMLPQLQAFLDRRPNDK